MVFDFFGRKSRKSAEDYERRAENYEREKKRKEIEEMERNSETQGKLNEYKSAIESKSENRRFIEAFKKVIDPELNIDVWTLGLIYFVAEDRENGNVKITMTLTSPACPYGPQLVENIVSNVEATGFRKEDVKVEVIFDPVWVPSEELKGLMFS
jgi:metal-sulfur cluster biosynthetic enzyme